MSFLKINVQVVAIQISFRNNRPIQSRLNYVTVSVEAPTFIAIGRSCLDGCGFDSHCRPGSFLRFNSRPVMYGADGSLASSVVLGPSIWVQFPLEPLNLIV